MLFFLTNQSNRMHRFIPQKGNLPKLFFLAVIVSAISSCTNDANLVDPVTENRGTIVSSELLHRWTTAQVDSAKNRVSPLLAGAVPTEYAVEIWRIVYNTIDGDGNAAKASGAFVFPLSTGRRNALASYQHGTVTEHASVPGRDGYEQIVGTLLASNSGIATAMPDYLGLGHKPGNPEGLYSKIHPYVVADVAATATVDLLRACRKFTQRDTAKYRLNEQVFLFGYSQGGQATMAALKMIETHHADEFKIAAAAPMAGPYDLGGVQADALAADTRYDAPYYLPFVMLAFNEQYNLYPSVGDFIKFPYSQQLPSLYDGYHGGGAIDRIMPDTPNRIIKTYVLDDYRTNSNHRLRVALKKNDLTNWKPKSRMKMYHCDGDQLVPIANTNIAYSRFIANGASAADIQKVEVQALLGLGPTRHQDCALWALLDCLSWFRSLRN